MNIHSVFDEDNDQRSHSTCLDACYRRLSLKFNDELSICERIVAAQMQCNFYKKKSTEGRYVIRLKTTFALSFIYKLFINKSTEQYKLKDTNVYGRDEANNKIPHNQLNITFFC